MGSSTASETKKRESETKIYDSATKMCDSEKMGSSTASTYIFTYIYIIYIYFTVYNI